ncbi:MAG: hypothetical protein ACRYG4_17795 [Janthinobacterium lividum]
MRKAGCGCRAHGLEGELNVLALIRAEAVEERSRCGDHRARLRCAGIALDLRSSRAVVE